LAVLMIPVINAIITLRWSLVCSSLAIEIPLFRLFEIYYISWFLSALPVLGVAPAARFLYLIEDGKTPAASAISIVADKILDIIGLFAIAACVLFAFPGFMLPELHLWLVVSAMLAGMAACLALSKRFWTAVKKFMQKYFIRGLRKFGSGIEDSLQEYWGNADWKFYAKVAFITVAVAAGRAVALYLLAFSLHIHVSFALIFACRALIGVLNIIPVSISGLGTRDALLLLVLPTAGVSPESAIALGLTAFLWTLFSKFSGIVFWIKNPLPLNRLRSFRNRPESEARRRPQAD